MHIDTLLQRMQFQRSRISRDTTYRVLVKDVIPLNAALKLAILEVDRTIPPVFTTLPDDPFGCWEGAPMCSKVDDSSRWSSATDPEIVHPWQPPEGGSRSPAAPSVGGHSSGVSADSSSAAPSPVAWICKTNAWTAARVTQEHFLRKISFNISYIY